MQSVGLLHTRSGYYLGGLDYFLVFAHIGNRQIFPGRYRVSLFEILILSRRTAPDLCERYLVKY